MKKSTFIVVLIAVALGLFIYFYGSGPAPKKGAPGAETTAFKVAPGAISNITLEHKGETVVLTKQKSSWQIVKPVATRADQGTVDGIADDLSDLQIQRSFVPEGDLSKYGLASPVAQIEFQDTKGAEHTIQLGDADFSGGAVYAVVDHPSPEKVALVSSSLLTDATKSLNDLRDRSLLDLNGSSLTAVTIHNPSGTIALQKIKSHWQITSPEKTRADSEAVDSITNSLSNSKFNSVVNETETAASLSRYGLTHPSITVEAVAKNGQQFHLLLSKRGANYYGRDTQRPMIFTVDSAIYDSFDKKFFDLRDKDILHFDSTNLATVTVHNAYGTIECAQGKVDEWTMVQPAAQKGKSVEGWKLTDPIQNARAKQIYDHPSMAILAHLKKPAVEIVFTDKSGKSTTIRISSVVGKSVYIQTSAAPQVYVVGHQILKDLGFKPSDLIL